MLSETAAFPLFEMVTVVVAEWSESTSPKLTLPGEITTGNTVRLATAALPVPPSFEVTLLVVLV